MNPDLPNQQPVPGGIPQYAGPPQPGMPYVPPHTLADTAANIGSAPQQQMPGQQPQPAPQHPMMGGAHYQPLPAAAPQPTVPDAPVVGQAQPSNTVAKAVPHANPNSTQNMLQIAEIRDGIVIMND